VLSEAIIGKGEAMFREACRMGLEGIVSKRLGSAYASTRTRNRLKVKNPSFEAELTRYCRGAQSKLQVVFGFQLESAKMNINSSTATKPYVWLALFPLIALSSPSDFEIRNQLFRAQSIGGAGGSGGNNNVQVIIIPNVTLYPQGGSGGNGGNATTPCGKKVRVPEGTTQLHPPRPFAGSPC
jgi:hypothetical protein